MPSQILHVLHGLRARASTEAAAEAALPEGGVRASSVVWNPSFCLGCQGPDIFYHSQRHIPRAIGYGTLLHRRGFGSFSAILLKLALDRCERNGEAPAQSASVAFSAGFLLHASLDRMLHPYIVYRTGSPLDGTGRRSASESSRAHIFFERVLDVLLLERLEHVNVSDWDQEALLAEPSRAVPDELPELCAQALRTCFPERTESDPALLQRMRNAFLDSGRFYSLTSPAAARTYAARFGSSAAAGGEEAFLRFAALIHPQAAALDADFLNLKQQAWRHPCPPGLVSDSSVPELFQCAVKEAAALLSLAEDLASERDGERRQAAFERLAAAVGDSGLSLSDGEGKRCSPTHFGPFDLSDLLAEHARSLMLGVG